MEIRALVDQLERTKRGLAPSPARQLPPENATARCLSPFSSHPALQLIAARPDIFARQGSVAASYRRRGPNTKAFGPYYRLNYREDRRQRSVYLGRNSKLVAQVRRALAELQKPLTARRALSRTYRAIRVALREDRLRVNALLRPYGLRLKGFEVRGWRFSPLRVYLPRFRRQIRRIALRSPPLRTRPGNDPRSRLRRYLLARDGCLPAD